MIHSTGSRRQQQGGQDQGSREDRISRPAATSPSNRREPQTIEKGQTTDQVQAALGKPDKIVNLGTKQIYIYKDMKVTFINGKVTDVQ